ncbi:serine/threonine-protein kinase [Streptomyces sp. P1-3]|uniref:serine/threonine-protein kinase n=1 Tax=Streptomyces sp. P1-3 TaxID=3421658 RepID=UPI003D36DCE5
MHPLQADDPQVIGAYRLLGRLGAGGMGRVYVGRTAGGRTVAVKVVHPHLTADEEFRARFRREVEAARRVGGDWTAPVLDADPEAAVPWVATGYVAGPPLSEAVGDTGPLPEPCVRALAAGLAEALATVHALGLVHRDVKPSNVLLTLDGPRLIDFGIARAVDGTVSLTSTGTSIGSPGYMSPEQILGQPVRGSADVFSLGAVLAYAATGAGPFPGDSSAALLYKVVHEEARLDPRLTGDLRDLVAACLAKEPADRPTPEQIVRGLAPTGGAAALAGPGWLPGPLVERVSRQAVALLDLEATAPVPSPPPPSSAEAQGLGLDQSRSPSAGVPGRSPSVGVAGQSPSVEALGQSQSPSVGVPGLGQVPSVGVPGLGQVPSAGVPGLGQSPSAGVPGLGQSPSAGIPGQSSSVEAPGLGQVPSADAPGQSQTPAAEAQAPAAQAEAPAVEGPGPTQPAVGPLQAPGPGWTSSAAGSLHAPSGLSSVPGQAPPSDSSDSSDSWDSVPPSAPASPSSSAPPSGPASAPAPAPAPAADADAAPAPGAGRRSGPVPAAGLPSGLIPFTEPTVGAEVASPGTFGPPDPSYGDRGPGAPAQAPAAAQAAAQAHPHTQAADHPPTQPSVPPSSVPPGAAATEGAAPRGGASRRIAVSAAIGGKDRPKAVSCSLVLSVAGALAVATTGAFVFGLLPGGGEDAKDRSARPPRASAVPSTGGPDNADQDGSGPQTPDPGYTAPDGSTGSVPKSFIGTWTGGVKQQNGTPNGTMTATITAGNPGDVVIRTRYEVKVQSVGITCHAKSELTSADGKRIQLVERTDDSQPTSALCTHNTTTTTFALQDDGTLLFTSQDPDGGKPSSRLTKDGA